MEVLSPPLEVIILVSCLLAGITGYVIGFSKVVQRNINRINLLPARACVFAFTAWRGYLMIAVMIVLGLTLRNTSIPKTYLSVPYAIMGSVLLIGSVGFFREFFNGLTRKNRMET